MKCKVIEIKKYKKSKKYIFNRVKKAIKKFIYWG